MEDNKVELWKYFNLEKEELIKKISILEEEALNNNLESSYELAFLCEHAIGVEEDKNKAWQEYKKAASQGHSSAINNLGYMCEGKKVTDHNIEKSIEYYEHAALQGNTYAQYNLASLLEKHGDIKKL